MSKHTPGPWAVHSAYPWIIKQGPDVPFIQPDSGVTICNTMGHENSGFFPTPEEGRANARLIAAAPELLEALKLLDEAFCADDYGTKEGRAKGRAALVATRAAIAKAEGKQ